MTRSPGFALQNQNLQSAATPLLTHHSMRALTQAAKCGSCCVCPGCRKHLLLPDRLCDVVFSNSRPCAPVGASKRVHGCCQNQYSLTQFHLANLAVFTGQYCRKVSVGASLGAPSQHRRASAFGSELSVQLSGISSRPPIWPCLRTTTL